VVTLDTQESVLTAVYTLLVADTTLKTAMGGTVRLYPVWAPPDATFPYLVNRLDMIASDPFPARAGTYIVDIWSNSVAASEIVAIRKRLIELLDEYMFNTTDVKNIKLMLQTDGFIPETEPDIWHYTIQFNVRLWRQSEFLYINNR